MDAFVLGQIPRLGRSGGRPLGTSGRPPAFRIVPAVTPLAPGALVDADHLRCRFVAVTEFHKTEILRPLDPQLLTPLWLPISPGLEVHPNLPLTERLRPSLE